MKRGNWDRVAWELRLAYAEMLVNKLGLFPSEKTDLK